MSTLKADTIVAADGSSPVTLTKQSAAKAWVNFNGTGTIAARDSYNLSSLTDSGTGLYVVNHTSSMSDANYSAVSGGSRDDPENSRCHPQNLYTFASGSYKIATYNDGSTRVDWTIITQSVNGDLA